MRMYDVIEKKKNGGVLTDKEIGFVVDGYTNEIIPDYQMSAFLMAVCFQGMNDKETATLTECMAKSGDMLDLSSIEGIKVDKHSTGGVGDTTTLIVAPLVAAAGVPVAKMSGRGLGFTGGTADKIEAFDNFNVEVPQQKFIENVNKYNICLATQTGNLAPADKKIYALRDVTATVDNISLIAASIMSKKIASGADAIVLDVKCGTGAFMKSVDEACNLAETMVAIGKNVGREVVALVTDMNQPLSSAIGNSIEIIEAIETLKGKGPCELTEVSIELAAYMLVLAKRVSNLEDGKTLINELITSGKAIEKMKEWVEIQGGNPLAIDDYTLLPQAKHKLDILSKEEGYISAIDTELLGKSALVLGAGRENKESIIDLAVGLKVHKRIGDKVDISEPIATIYYNDESKVEAASKYLFDAYKVSKEAVNKLPLIYKVIK